MLPRGVHPGRFSLAHVPFQPVSKVHAFLVPLLYLVPPFAFNSPISMQLMCSGYNHLAILGVSAIAGGLAITSGAARKKAPATAFVTSCLLGGSFAGGIIATQLFPQYGANMNLASLSLCFKILATSSVCIVYECIPLWRIPCHVHLQS